MKKHTALFLLLFILQTYTFLSASPDQFEIWLAQSLEMPLTKSFIATFNNEYRFRDSFEELDYFHMEPILAYEIYEAYRIGVRSRIVGKKRGSNIWERIMEPGIISTASMKLLTLSLYFRAILYYRFFEHSEEDRGALRVRLGTDLVSYKFFTLGIMNEQFYNHHNTQDLDRNRLTVLLKGNFFESTSWSIWFMHEFNQARRDRNVVGLTLKAQM